MRRPYRLTAALLTAAALVLGGVTQSASADDLSHKRSQVESQIAAAQKQQDDLEASIEDMSGNLAQAQSDLQAIEQQIPAAQQKLDDATATLEKAQREQQQIADELTDAENQQTTIAQQLTDGAAQQQQLRDAVGAMAREAYRDGGDVSGLSVVLDAQSTDDFVDSYAMLAAAQRAQSEVFGRMADLEADARNQAARLDSVTAKITDLKVVWRLARLHARVWRALIEGDLRAFESRRGELVAALAQEDLDLDRVAEADARALHELLTVVVDRFHRMPRVSMGYHLALLELAGRLSPGQGMAQAA